MGHAGAPALCTGEHRGVTFEQREEGGGKPEWVGRAQQGGSCATEGGDRGRAGRQKRREPSCTPSLHVDSRRVSEVGPGGGGTAGAMMRGGSKWTKRVCPKLG